MAEIRALGTVIKFDTATDIALSVTITGSGSTTLNSSDSDFLQIPEGSVWRLPDLCQYIEYQLAEWLYAAMDADAAVTTKPGAARSIETSITITPSLVSNGGRCTLTLGASLDGARISGTLAAITAVTLTNTNGLWSKLGLMNENSTSQAMTVVAGVATRAGIFQPRSIFFFDRSEIDEGERPEAQQYKALRLSDGSGSTFLPGRLVSSRVLRLLDLDEATCGRAKPIARLGDSGVSSVTLNVNDTIEVGYNLGVTGTQYASDLASATVSAGAYVDLGGVWVGRVSSASSSAILLREKVPASISPPAGCVISRISDVQALWFEALRTSYVCVFDMVETLGGTFGQPYWVGADYMLDEASKSFTPERRDSANALYSYTFNLKKRDLPGLNRVV